MKMLFFISLLIFAAGEKSFAQNTLDNAGLTASTPSQIAFSLRKMSSSYSGYAIKVRRTSDNAEANLAFDVSGGITASSVATFTPGVTTGAAFGTSQSGTITTTAAKTGLVSIAVNKTGLISASTSASLVTGLGTSFTTDCPAGSLLFNATNTFLGVVASVTNNTNLQLTNYSTGNSTLISYKTASAVVTGTGTSFTSEFTTGDRLFNSTNGYLGTVSSVTSNTVMTLNAVDAVSATLSTIKGSLATVTGVGTSFATLNIGDLLISNNITLGIISAINSATSVTLTTKAGAAVTGQSYKSTTGSITFSSFYSGTSVYLNTWYDQSGFNRNATQLKQANQARVVNTGVLYIVNGRTSLEFSSAMTSFVQTSTVAVFLNNTLYTLNKVTAEATINPSLQLPISTTGGNGPNNTISHYGYRSSNQFTVAQYGNDQNFNATPSTTLELHTSVKISTASSQFYKNGISLGILTSGAGSNLNNVGVMNIGFYTPTVSYYNGSISELMVFSIALTAAEVALLDNNQLAYYNIATTFWTGAVSTAWTNPLNWSTGIVPTITDPAIVVIPAGKPNYPVISTVAPANSISLETGTSLTITGTLQLAGTLINLGTCTATSGTVQYVGSATQSITAGTFAGNAMQNMIVNNSTGVALSTNLTISGNLSFTTGYLSIGSFLLTLGGSVTNTIPGGIRGSATSLLTLNGTVSPTLSFDQTTIGTTNVLKNLTINSAGQNVVLANNLIMTTGGITTFTAGKLSLASSTLTLRGSVVNTVAEGITGSHNASLVVDGTASPTLSFDQSLPGTSNSMVNLTLNCAGQTVTLNRPLSVITTLTLTAGTLADAGNQVGSGGTINLVAGTFKLGSSTTATNWPAFTVNNISATGIVDYASGVAQIVSATPNYQNLIISATGGTTAANNLTVNNVLTLSAANPSATSGSLSMSTFTLNMGASATTVGQGDVSGIVKRTTILPNVSYSMGNEFSNITFPNVGTLPSQMSMKITVGTVPSWQSGAILRTYDFIQTGGTGTKAVITAHYLDGELNGNAENKLVDFSFRFTGAVLTEHGKSNSNAVQNWVALSNVNVAFFAATFGSVQLSLDESALTTLTWNGATSTSWITATNWTPNGGPSTNTILIIPDAATTPNDPSMPATASNGSITIETGGIVNSDPGAQMIINNTGLAWSNNGTFNAGTSTIFFANANSTMNGTTNFNNVTINSGAALQMSTDNIMRIGGTMTNNGSWIAGLLKNTIQYNGNAQTILIPNGSTASYYNLIVSGTGTNILPAATINILGDLSVNATVSITGNTISMNGAIPQSINGTSAFALNNLTINNTSGAVTLNQNLTVANALTLTSGHLAIGSSNLTLSGNIINTIPNGITGSPTGSIILNGAFSPALSFDQSMPGVSNALNNLSISSSGQIISISSDLEVNGNLLFTAGKLAINGNTLTLKNNLTNTASEGLRGSSSSNLIVSGGLASQSLSFDQSTPGVTNLLNNFTMNSNSKSAILTNPLILNGSLNLTDGNIITTNLNSLTMNAGAVYTGGSDNSYVDGPLRRTTNSLADYTYPVGKSGAYDPIVISPAATTTGVFIAEYFPANPPAGTIFTSLIGLATDEYWDINKISGPDAYVTLLYHDDNTWTPGSPNSLDLIVVAALNAGSWTPQVGDAIPGNTPGGTTPIKSKIQTSFASYTFGFGESANLPLTLLSFKGKKDNDQIKLIWTTSGEYNVDGFEMQRSVDGLHFDKIGFTKATNTSLDKTYEWTDQHPFDGLNYYRLKMTDLDAVFNYSSVVQVNMRSDKNEISVYPNPLTGHRLYIVMTGQLKGLYQITIYNNAGQRLFSGEFLHDGLDAEQAVILNNLLPHGVCYFEITGPGQKKKTFKLFKE